MTRGYYPGDPGYEDERRRLRQRSHGERASMEIPPTVRCDQCGCLQGHRVDCPTVERRP